MGPLIEIIFFALISAYLFYKLWLVLGQETDDDAERRERRRKFLEEDLENNVVPIRSKTSDDFYESNEDSLEANLKPGAKEGLRQLKTQESDFSLRNFLEGSRKAYTMIIEAYSDGDLKTLKTLLTNKVYDQFEKAINDQKSEGTITKTRVEKIDRLEVDAINVHDHSAQISVRFRSRQIIITQTENGTIIDNPAEVSIPITDIWTFERTLNTSDPIWYLKATSSESYRD